MASWEIWQSYNLSRHQKPVTGEFDPTSEVYVTFDFTRYNYRAYKTSGGSGAAGVVTVARTDGSGNPTIYLDLPPTPTSILREYGSTLKFYNRSVVDTSSFTIERLQLNQNPTLTLTTTNNVILSAGNNLTLSGNVSDADGNSVTVSATIDGKTRSAIVNGSGTWTLQWSGSELAEGTYTGVVITADDGQGGTASVTYTGTILVDKTLPSISITGVTDGQTYQSATITYSATDAGGSNLASVSATLNGAAFASGTTIATGGDYALVVTAEDNAGNTATQTVSFRVNKVPNVTLTTPDSGEVLSQNKTYRISGQATDGDSSNTVSVKYTLNNGTVQTLVTAPSDGITPITFDKTLTFKDGRFYDGANPITPVLPEGTTYTLKVWAEDNVGAKSAEVARTFTTVPNYRPTLTATFTASATDLIPIDTHTISGTVTDADNEDVTVYAAINDGDWQEVFTGTGVWSYTYEVRQLSTGANTVKIKAVDVRGGVTEKHFRVTKTVHATPLDFADVRYKVIPKDGVTNGATLFVYADNTTDISAELSVVGQSDIESYVQMDKNSDAYDADTTEFVFRKEGMQANDNITLKLSMTGTGGTDELLGSYNAVTVTYNEYGVEWDKATDTVTRIGLAQGQSRSFFDNVLPWSGIRRCNMNDNGVVTAYYGDPAYKDDGTNGQVMVEIPQFWYRFTTTGDKRKFSIFDGPAPGAQPAFVANRDGVAKPQTKGYIGAFEGSVSGGVLRSVAGVLPTVNLALGQARAAAQARGAGWKVNPFGYLTAVQMLMLVEYATFDLAGAIGQGIINDTAAHVTGETTTLGNTTGTVGQSISYRGIENMWGNVQEWIEGLVTGVNEIKVGTDGFNDTGAGYTTYAKTFANAAGYISDVWGDAELGFIGREFAGSNVSKLRDYGSLQTDKAAVYGAHFEGSVDSGAFGLRLNYGSTYKDGHIGARLAY